MNDEKYIKILLSERFTKILPKDYAEKVKIKFKCDRSLWYKAIAPKEMADKFYQDVEGDYSKIWHVHCDICFVSIDKKTKDFCYVSEDEISWLCKDCYKKLFNIIKDD